MNNARRKILISAQDHIQKARDLIEQALTEEQDYYDSMPESFQNGQKGETAMENIGRLEEILNTMADADEFPI